MRTIALLLSFAMLVQFNLLIAPTYADSVTITTTTTSAPGGLTGQVPVTKVGALIAGDALAILSGTEIKIESKSHSHSSNPPTTPPSNLLTGVLLQTKTVGPGATGYAVFNGGDRFSRINSSSCPDRITTNAGATFTGTITSVTATAIGISTSSGAQSINSSDIAEIHSARAFKYNLPDAASPQAKMEFTATCQHSVAASEHGNTVKKLIIVGLALTVIAVAIAVPVGIAASRHHHHNNNYNNIVAANLLNSRQPVVSQPMMPMGTSMPTPQQLGQIYILNLQRLQGTSGGAVSGGSRVFGSVTSSGSSSSTSGSTTPPIIIP